MVDAGLSWCDDRTAGAYRMYCVNRADTAAKSRCSDLKALYMSGYAEHAIFENELLQEGMAFMSKPFTRAGLARRVV